MPRRVRLKVAGLPLHIIQRGNNRSACFYADEDYALYLHHLGEMAREFHCAVHAYVLMTNHVHLLLTPALPDGPSLLMKHLGQPRHPTAGRAHRHNSDFHKPEERAPGMTGPFAACRGPAPVPRQVRQIPARPSPTRLAAATPENALRRSCVRCAG